MHEHGYVDTDNSGTCLDDRTECGLELRERTSRARRKSVSHPSPSFFALVLCPLSPQMSLSLCILSRFANRSIPIPRGKVLGGSNELNFMLHVRGTPADYDLWSEMVGDDAWGAEEMAKMEDIYEEFIHVTRVDPGPMASRFLDASRKTTLGVQMDYNGRQRDREGAMMYFHGVKSGVRQSTARNMLLPRMNPENGDLFCPNLHLLTNAEVKQVLLDKDDDAWIAKGVRVVRNGVESIVRVRHEIVLSAGAYGTPHLLQVRTITPLVHDNASVTRSIYKQLTTRPRLGLRNRRSSTSRVRFGHQTASRLTRSRETPSRAFSNVHQNAHRRWVVVVSTNSHGSRTSRCDLRVVASWHWPSRDIQRGLRFLRGESPDVQRAP